MSKYYYKATIKVDGVPQFTCEGQTPKECADNAVEIMSKLPETAVATCQISKIDKVQEAYEDIQKVQ